MALNHEGIILAAIIPNRRDRLLFALQHLTMEHFRTETMRHMFKLLEDYYAMAADILPLKTLADLMEARGAEPGRALLYGEVYSKLANHSVADHEFRYSIHALKDLRALQATGEALTTGMEILERGLELDGEERQGHEETRKYLYEELSRIDKLDAVEFAPEGDMTKETADMLQEYVDRKNKPDMKGIATGITTLDRVTAGFQPGELVMMVGYTGEGKSMIAAQTAWHAAIKEGKNVFFATSETIRPQVRRRILARHSREERFGLEEGLNTSDLKNGTLTPEQESSLAEVLNDLLQNPTYGKLYIAQIPRGATLGFLEARLQRQQAQWNIDLVVMDYLALLKPETKRQSQREELADILKDAKVLAATFDQGRGVPFISPWSVSKTAYDGALKSGAYGLTSLADTSEAEKSADCIVSVLRDPSTGTLKMQVLKNRDGETPPAWQARYDFRNAYVEERVEMTSGAMDDTLEAGSVM